MAIFNNYPQGNYGSKQNEIYEELYQDSLTKSKSMGNSIGRASLYDQLAGTVTTSASLQQIPQGQYVTGNWNINQYDAMETKPATGRLESLIELCGKQFYYLCSPSVTDDGTWHAKGTRAVGKGATAVEAVNDLITKLTPEEEGDE